MNTPKTASVRCPLVHLNGTGVEDLMTQYTEVARNCRDVLKALEMATPHGRDYYLLGDSAYTEAVKEHGARIAAIRKVMTEVNEIALNISAQRGQASLDALKRNNRQHG
jgi:ferredoxin-NADP reductase